MLIVCRIFHISTRYYSCAFAIDRCLISQPFVAPLFYLGCARGVFIATPYHRLHVHRGYCFFAVFGDWYVFDVMIFFGALLFFDFRRLLALLPFVCVVFPILAANKHFFLTCLPPMSQVCSDVISCFSNVSCETLLFFLQNIASSLFVFYSIRGDICGFCCLVFPVFACCHTVLCGLRVGCLLLAFIGARCRGIIFLLRRTGIIRTGFGAADFRLNRVSRLANTGWY